MDIGEDSVLPTKVEVFEHAQIFQLCSLPLVQKYVETMDLSFYQVVIDVLMPNVLSVVDCKFTLSSYFKYTSLFSTLVHSSEELLAER